MQTLNTLELKIGDIVHVHGCRFRLTDRLEFMAPTGIIVVNFATELLSRETDSLMSQEWAQNWHIQGNCFAHWQVEKENDHENT
jgi:hypothetical protein